MSRAIPEELAFSEALAVASGKPMPATDESDTKMLALVLHEGECNVEISVSVISIRYSWLHKRRPSTYFISLAPGLIGGLMQLGGVHSIGQEATFEVGPGVIERERSQVEFGRKWIRIACEPEQIKVRVRYSRERLDSVSSFIYENESAARCNRCNSELRTPLAKQCLNCGHDWH